MAGEFSFSFDKGKFTTQKQFDQRLGRAVFGVAKYWDGRIESHMKQNAPWNDRTTNARNGLFATATKLGDAFAIILGHSVTYGIYLELGTRFMRARPIIVPTIEEFAPKVMQTLSKILSRL